MFTNYAYERSCFMIFYSGKGRNIQTKEKKQFYVAVAVAFHTLHAFLQQSKKNSKITLKTVLLALYLFEKN
jgi:hypothetical protein